MATNSVSNLSVCTLSLKMSVILYFFFLGEEHVKFAIVVDNQSSRANVDMDFVGMTINKNEDDVWVDFPYEDWWTK